MDGASKEQGEKVLETLADFIGRVVEELRRIDLPLAITPNGVLE